MTTLTITPNWKNKTARFKGTIAAGEHVAVSIANDDNYITDTTNLRLRVVNPANGKTLAQFPMPETADDETDGENEVLPSSEAPAEGEADWASDLTPLFCILNLNTVQMLKAVPPAANVPLLFVLDAYKEASDGESGEFTLYFKDMCEVTHWPRRTGEDEPTNLDDYKDIIADFREDIYGEGGFKDRVESAESAAQSAAESARLAEEHAGNSESGAEAAASAAQASAGAAATAKTAAETAQGKAEDAQSAAETAQGKAETAQSAAEAAAEAAEAALPLDTTLSIAGKAADAKAVGDALALKADKSDTYTKSETDGKVAAEAQARALLAATVQTNAETIAAHTSSLASLSSRVGDNETAIANRYTKSEVDAKVAGVQTFQKLVVNELPSAEAADDKTIYLVPRTGSETPDLCDEYVVVGAAGSRRWEKIGGGTVDLANYYTKAETNAALAGKASTADATLTPIYSNTPTFSEWTYSQFPDGWSYFGDPVYGGGKWFIEISNSEGETGLEIAGDEYATVLTFDFREYIGDVPNAVITASRRRTDIIGYTLGSQTDKPLQPQGNYALLSDIAVKSVKLNGTALTPDASGAVNVPALPLAGGTMTGDIFTPNAIWLTNSGIWTGILQIDGDGALQSLVGGSNIHASFADIIKTANGSSTDYAPLASPAFTGTPTAPTPASGDNSTKVATTAFVQNALPYAIASVPSGDALADRTVNTKTVNAATYAPSFPTETSGKSCDFYLAITSDTAGTVSAPSGKTLYNAKGESANLDYEANKTTLLRFTQIGANTYVVTGGANGGGSVDPAQLAGKLDSEAAAPDYDPTATYAEGEYVTYLGKLYYAKQAITTAEEWTAAHWQVTDMTSPDATFDVTSQNALRLVDANGNRLWMQGYNLETPTVTSGAATLSNESVNYIELASSAAADATVTLSLPARSTGKVSDFVLDVANKTTGYALTLALDSTALDTTFGVVVPDGDDLTTMFTVAAGEMAEFYFTLTQFTKTPTGGSGTIPMYKVVKQVVVDATEASA